MKFYCYICAKEYKNSKSLYAHNSKFHNTRTLTFRCGNCNKKFPRKCNLARHKKYCYSNEDDETPELLDLPNLINTQPLNTQPLNKQPLNKQLNNQINKPEKNINSANSDIIQGDYNTMGNNNVSNNISNNVSFNQIKIVPLGQENLSEVLNATEQINILNKKYQALEEMIKYVHFNDKYPQFQNMMVTDLSRTHAYKYDNNKNDYIVVKKQDLLNDIIENRVDDIGEFYNNHFQKLSKASQQAVGKYIEKIINDETNNEGKYLKGKKKAIELIMYNNTKMVKKKLLKLKRKEDESLIISKHNELES
jgi:hypothetical protein